MDYVNLGKTGLKVSRICLGTLTFGDPKQRAWAIPEEESRPIIQRAVDLGINFFDTADTYSNGASEEILGRALRDFTRRDEVVIATKVFSSMGDKPNQRGLSRVHILNAIDDFIAAAANGLCRPVPDPPLGLLPPRSKRRSPRWMG